jgi:hydrogenase maturation protease
MLREVQFTDSCYMVLEAELAREHFPTDTLLAMKRGNELWLLPTRGAAGGGLLLKQRNTAGDRSVLVSEALADTSVTGRCPAYWDDAQGALRVAITAAAAP